MNLARPFIQRPVMTTFLMLALLLAGISAFFKLPVTDLPSVEYPYIEVSAGYIGASSDKILHKVTRPLEEELSHVGGLQELSSTSTPGRSQIQLSFGLDSDMDRALRDVQAAINRAQAFLPEELSPRPSYSLHESNQEPIMYVALSSDQMNVQQMYTMASDFILPRLGRIEGIAQVALLGTHDSIWVQIHPELMASHHVGFDQILDALDQSTTQIPLGTIQTNHRRLSIEMITGANCIKDLSNLVVGPHGVHLRDIADIVEKPLYEQAFQLVTTKSSIPTVILRIQKLGGANTVAISKQAQNVLEDIKKQLPPSVNLTLWFDKAVWIQESLTDVAKALFLAFALVVVVIYVSLGRWMQAWITALALPLSLMATFAIMQPLGFNLDLLSLLALALSVGFIVDDAIVVVENIVRQQELGLSSYAASLKGAKQIGFTILSITLSLVAVFIPLLFMSGINGRLLREFSMTLAISILVSGVLSLTFIPMLSARFLPHLGSPTRLQINVNHFYALLAQWYGESLQKVLIFKKTMAGSAVLGMLACGFLFTRLPVNLVPSEDRGFLFAYIALQAGTAPHITHAHQLELEKIVQDQKGIDNFLSMHFDDGILYIIRLKDAAKRPDQEIIRGNLRRSLNQIPGIEAFVRPYSLINLGFDFGQGSEYKYMIRSQEFADVRLAADKLAEKLRQDPSFEFVRTSTSHDTPMLAMEVDESLAKRFGVTNKQIQQLLQFAYGQQFAGSFFHEGRDHHIYMELAPAYQNYRDAPNKLYLHTSNGATIPLRSIVNWKEQLGPADLQRRDKLAMASVEFSLASGVDAVDSMAKVQAIAATLLPSHTMGGFSRSAELLSSTMQDTLWLLLAASLVMYIVLGILYESFIHPLTILSSIPLAGLGGVMTLLIFGEPLSLFSAVGFLLLIGIVKKNGIMIIDYALQAQQEGISHSLAIKQACLVRFRPIMMTTLAAVAGALPLALGLGSSAQMLRGLGLVIVGGLLFSQLLTLYVTPALFLCFDQFSSKKENTKPIHS